MQQSKFCLHCRKPKPKSGICDKCLTLPKCSKCTVIMCKKKEHMGKASILNNDKCESCTRPFEHDPKIQQILKTFPKIALIIK